MACIYSSIPHAASAYIAGLYKWKCYTNIPCHSASYHPAYNMTSQHGYKSVEGSLNSANTLTQQDNASVILHFVTSA